MKKIIKTYSADLESIDMISRTVRDFLSRSDVENEICLRISLTVEEALNNIINEFGEGHSLELYMYKRLGKPWIRLKFQGKRFDPIREHNDELSELILNNLGISPVWTYRSGTNQVTFKVPSSNIRSEFLLAGSVLLALLLGACAGVIPAGVKEGIILFILTPITDIFLRLLITLAPMLIFLSVLTSVFMTGQGADFNRIGKYIIGRYITVTASLVVIFTTALIPMFHLDFEKVTSGVSTFNKLYELILNIFPSNIILPFSENSTMQIIVLAMLLGTIILNLDNRVEGLRSTLVDLRTVFLNAVEAVCRFLPVFVFASLLKLFWSQGFGTFAKLWKPILAAFLVEYTYILIIGIYISIKMKVSLPLLYKKLFPSFIVGLTTGSSIAAFTNGMMVNTEGLGISESYSRLAYPLGISLYVGPYAPLFISITYYMAEIFQTPVSPIWFITVALICFIFAFATPQVSGGALICLGILMTQLNIPSEGIAVAGTLAMILDFISTAAKVLGQHLEMTLQAHKLEMIDLEVLRRR